MFRATITLLLFAFFPVQANDNPYCEVGIGGGLIFGETGQAREITLAPREQVDLLCSNKGRVEILLCEVQ